MCYCLDLCFTDPQLEEDEGATVFVTSAMTEGPSSTVLGGVTSGVVGSVAAPDEMSVSVRLIEEGALVRWSRAPGDAARCTLRWYDASEPDHRLLATVTTQQDYILGSYAIL